jgi:hypothetical protein
VGSRRRTGRSTDLDAKPFVPLLQLTAHTGKEIRRVGLDAVKPDLQRAWLSINDDAARRMQWVLVSGWWATGPGRCHQLMSVIIPEPVGHGCDDSLPRSVTSTVSGTITVRLVTWSRY